MLRLRFIAIILLIFFSQMMFAEDVSEYNRKIENSNRKLKNIDNEIKKLRQNINKKKRAERSLVDELNQSEQEISLINKKMDTQKEKLDLQKNKLHTLETKKSVQIVQKKELKERYKKRVVRFYMDYEDDIYSYIVKSDNVNQFFYRIKYFNIINDIDKEIYDKIRFLINDIDDKTVQIYNEKKEIVNTINNFKEEDIKLKKIKSEKNRNLKKVKNNRLELTKALKNKRESRKKIQKMIRDVEQKKSRYLAELKRQRELRQQKWKKSYRKGEIPWPVYGSVISKFGKHKDPKLKTITENSGIDIRASKGTAVKTVMDGMIASITWLRGYGNTIMVFHENGFYTVYSHVDGIKVKANDYVKSGATIAEVSDSGSMNGDMLHFEIWNEKENLNPELWLKR